MKIVILGCGKVGKTILEQLVVEGHDLSVIDRQEDLIKRIGKTYDVNVHYGDGASRKVQIEAGVDSADMFIAVTDSDELNLLCCMIAKKTANCKTIARVRNPIYNDEIMFLKEEIGLSMVINPEYAAAKEIARILRFPSAIKIDTFSKGKVEMLEFKIIPGSPLCDLCLSDMSKKIKGQVLVCTVQRGNNVFIPNGNFILKEKDLISIVASHENSKQFFKNIGLNTHQVKDVMIVGGGRIAHYLSKDLLSAGIKIIVIEKDEKRQKELEKLLGDTGRFNVLQGDGTNKEVLIEEGIDYCSAFVSLTGIDEANIFLSLFAKSRTDAKVITKINRISFDDIVENFDLGSIIYPKFITAEYIVSYVRALQNGMGSNVETMYRILNQKAEALEFKIQPGSPVIGIPLEKLDTKDNVLIACIIRGIDVIFPNGSSVILEKDYVIVVTTLLSGFKDIKDIIKG